MRKLIDVAILIALCLYSYSSTIDHIGDQRDQGTPPFFYQSYFEPAVLMACGHEFGVLSDAKPESLTNFLNLKSSSFECNSLPEDPQISNPRFFGQWIYMMKAAAFTWKLFGIDWVEIDKLSGAFVAISIAALYGIFRIFLPIPVATLGAYIIISTHGFIGFSPFFRDLSKAPFILISLLALACIATSSQWRRTAPLFACIIGLTIGIGVGFRPDVMIVLPLAVFVIFAFPKGRGVKDIARKALNCILNPLY